MARKVFSLSIGLAAVLSASLSAQEPPPFQTVPGSQPISVTSSINQQLADSIATQLRGSGLMRGSSISIVAVDGTVELHGTTSHPQQAAQIAGAVQGMAGVDRVNNQLVVAQAQGEGAPIAGAPGAGAIPHGATVGMDPIPVAGPAYPQYDMNPPNMPPYAWPTYAPYNNFSRVAYPTTYPYNAFPYIGPYYPFPKVPLGWRKVTLEWEDGHWWYGRKAVQHDYWRVRFY